MGKKNLPSVFDLFFDVKTRKGLSILYKQLKDDVSLIEYLCESYGIDIKTLSEES